MKILAVGQGGTVQRKLIVKCMMLGLLLFLASLVGATAPPQSADNTRSPHGNLNMPCQNCHTVYGWKPIRAVPEFDHNQTKFPLRGLHEGVSCVSCHTKMVFTNVGNKCADCHADIHRGKMSAACETCHTVRGWKVNVSKINMHNNRFPLTGAHAAAACEDCHKNGALSAFTTMSTECISCHQKDFNSTTAPPHATTSGFSGTPCQSCHNTDSWFGAKFDHGSVGFALTGQHAVPPRACTDCHNAANGGFNITSTACQTCHQTDYNNTTNPNHVQLSGAFPIGECSTCHTNFVAWVPAQFPNHLATGFPLSGGHAVPPRQCSDCHGTSNYQIANATCVSCHQTDYNNTMTPNHVQAKFPTTCQTCHDTIQWTDAIFNHASTGFALTNSHAVPPRQCSDCHNAAFGGYSITSGACVNCHQKDYNSATTPVNHIAANFPLTCETCHDTVVWTDAKFDHTSFGFQLTNSHAVPPRACADCHNAQFGGYNITSTACINCHQSAWQSTTTLGGTVPNHVTANFPTTCEVCHDTVAWTDAVFNHNNTPFPLQGAHTTVPCANCHVNSNYTTLPTDCYGCHQKDYTGTTAPNHVAAGFPTTCVTCHTTWITTNWLGAVFNHTWFPMTHGGANGICATCHTNPNDFTVFQCTGCHGNNNSANFRHQAVAGYVYNSINCYQCHRNGNGG